ncbi:hypothetical protein AMECASPLE_023765 [Ameca splendens]|uniref:Uncharacterized protein n=1 Tax=Ameca splendens TaxID=208324 RepID=A0ABV1AAH2_9TELE
MVLGGVCPVAPVGRGWVALRGALALPSWLAVWWGTGMQQWCLECGCVELALCWCGVISFSGKELTFGAVPLWGGDSWRLGSGACVRYLCPGWGWPCGEVHVGVHVGVGGMELRSEFIGGLGLFHHVAVLVAELVWTR